MPSPDPPTSLARRLSRLPLHFGWVVVGVAFVTMAIGVNVRTAFSLLFPPILDEFGWARGVTAGAFSLGFVAATLYSPFIGVLMDRLGPRYVMPLGALLVAIGLVSATAMREPWHLYLTLGLLGVGASIVLAYIGHGAFLPHWFAKRRGLALGLAYSGVGAGSILLFPWLQQVIDQDGWRQACWAMGFLLVAVVMPLNLVLQRQRPEDLALRPYGAEAEPHARPAAGGRGASAGGEWTLSAAFRSAPFWWLCLAFFCGLIALYGVQIHQTRYLIELGFASDFAALALGLVPAGGIVAQIGIGHFSDRIGRAWGWTIGALGFTVCYALLLALPSFPSVALVYLMVAAQGLLGYGISPMYSAIPAEIFHGRTYGTIFGSLSAAAGLGAGTGPLLLGALYDVTGSYQAGFIVAGAASLVSVAAVWLAMPRGLRRR